jgi:2-oxoglutarate ferredoxin oxidoreductase subunit beta
MTEPLIPKCVKKSSKPSNFCPGCGHSIILKNLGLVIDEMKIAGNTVFATDIGCSLLAWDYYDIDTVQSHHGRAGCISTGLKRAMPKTVVIAYMGDGGGYAIGLHHLIHLAKRNEAVTVILVNNTVFAMTGGQAAPTTIPKEVTESTPNGVFGDDNPILGPELLKDICKDKAFLARTSVTDLTQLNNYLKKALSNQINNNAFSFVEVLSYCPVNWKKDAKGCEEYLEELKVVYKTGVIKGGS